MLTRPAVTALVIACFLAACGDGETTASPIAASPIAASPSASQSPSEPEVTEEVADPDAAAEAEDTALEYLGARQVKAAPNNGRGELTGIDAMDGFNQVEFLFFGPDIPRFTLVDPNGNQTECVSYAYAPPVNGPVTGHIFGSAPEGIPTYHRVNCPVAAIVPLTPDGLIGNLVDETGFERPVAFTAQKFTASSPTPGRNYIPISGTSAIFTANDEMFTVALGQVSLRSDATDGYKVNVPYTITPVNNKVSHEITHEPSLGVATESFAALTGSEAAGRPLTLTTFFPGEVLKRNFDVFIPSAAGRPTSIRVYFLTLGFAFDFPSADPNLVTADNLSAQFKDCPPGCLGLVATVPL